MRMPKIPRIAGFVFYAFGAASIWACLGLGLFYLVTGRADMDRWDVITLPLLALISVHMAGLAHQEWMKLSAAPSSSPDESAGDVLAPLDEGPILDDAVFPPLVTPEAIAQGRGGGAEGGDAGRLES